MLVMLERWSRAGLASVALLLALGPSSASAGGASAEAAFERLRALVGTWAAPAANGKEVRVNYRLVSAGSALVETYATPSGKETLTIFHLDGERLLATHYCAQKNQPRLLLTSNPSAPRMVFEFVDATNLKSRKAAHLRRLEVMLTDTDHFTRVETYRENDKDETDTLQLARVAVSP